jgi:hypothetical protein
MSTYRLCLPHAAGAHTIGRSHADRSGFGAKATKYTTGDNIGAPGGSSWVPDWLVFNNSYFQVSFDSRRVESWIGDKCLLIGVCFPKHRLDRGIKT